MVDRFDPDGSILRSIGKQVPPEEHTTIVCRKGAIRIELPGLTAVEIDPELGYIAVDRISGIHDGASKFAVLDLRDEGFYGDFHRLRSRYSCNDAECAASGQHFMLTWDNTWVPDKAEPAETSPVDTF